MYYAKAMLRDTLKVVEVVEIDFGGSSLWYIEKPYSIEAYLIDDAIWTDFDNVVWLECNNRPIEKKI